MDPVRPAVTTIVDTNVVAYYLLGTEPFIDEVRQFWRAVDETWAPAHWEAELANAVWMAVRTGALPREEGHQKLDMASRLGIQPVPIRPLWQAALTRALDSGVAVYDTLFVELAAQRDLKLATLTQNFSRRFPRSPNALVRCRRISLWPPNLTSRVSARGGSGIVPPPPASAC